MTGAKLPLSVDITFLLILHTLIGSLSGHAGIDPTALVKEKPGKPNPSVVTSTREQMLAYQKLHNRLVHNHSLTAC